MNFKLMASTLVLLSVISCGQMTKKSESDLKLYVLDCGTIDVSDISAFSPGVDVGVKKTLKNTCFLLDHAKGMMIWDTGLPDQVAKSKSGVTNGIFHLTMEKTLESQLKQINIDPKDVDYLALSHFHFDHSGNANLFENAKLIIQKEEYDAIYSKDPSKYHFDPKSYSKLKKEKAIIVNGDYDVFGDQRVKVVKTAGHTPGHQSLRLDLQSQGVVYLSGDLYHFEKNRTHMRVPGFNFNKKETIESMKHMEEVLKREKAKMWIQHDPVQFTKFKFSPEYYQ